MDHNVPIARVIICICMFALSSPLQPSSVIISDARCYFLALGETFISVFQGYNDIMGELSITVHESRRVSLRSAGLDYSHEVSGNRQPDACINHCIGPQCRKVSSIICIIVITRSIPG